MTIRSLYKIFENHPKINTDSRIDGQNGIFFALKGPNFDGNNFAESALKTNAYAVVDNPEVAIDDRYILVDSVLNTLQDLASYHRDHFDIPIIAITGTNGKTTTKELVAAVLSTKNNVYYTKGNLNNHIGVPISLLELRKEHQIAVIEMGASAIGEIAFLCSMVKPNCGIITNIGKAHLETFESFENIARAKSELYQYLYDSDGIAFVNYDNEVLEDLNPPKKTIYYGASKFTHCQGKLTKNTDNVELAWISVETSVNQASDKIWTDSNKYIKSNLVGSYNFENILAAICVGDFFGIEDIYIKEAIENYVPQNNRSQYVKTDNNKLIIDCYNANPTSMKHAISDFAKFRKDKCDKAMILGDMLELGEHSHIEHEYLLQIIERAGLTDVYFVGNEFSKRCKKYGKYFTNVYELIKYLEANPIKNHIILVKGSRGIMLEKAIPYL
ncbi:MAG: UDP-N-acetylmuramoyl-tripeptide--D-alanyl-D-alanine ligase [Salinivirgaceae bacterium]|jgi:UDP-N-acetylmuramoyl-tripeptide--D-alanyl-D-alanine ligase|nr:UDP-N-acetylmuramoyl-tripeptide--D-alanyl-D-alanine ligase [Bacteroidales bacterium]